MSLVVEQLIYSSFERVGFKYIASANIPLSIQQVFSQNIVSRLWDTYNPPPRHHKGVYLYQIARDKLLFGWLRHDGIDELGRLEIPYFHGYYLTETLDSQLLVKVLACLEAGPIERFERDRPVILSDRVEIPDHYRADTLGMGIKLSKDLRLFSHRQLREGKLLQWYVSAKETAPPPKQPTNGSRESALAKIEAGEIAPVGTSEIERVVRELMAKPISIEGIALVSPEGQPLMPSIGIEESSSQLLSGTMLYLANNTLEELAWDSVEQIAIRGRQGNLILTACTSEAYLLVKTGRVVSGLIEAEIRKTRAKLRILLGNPLPPNESSPSTPLKARLESSRAVSPLDTVFYEPDATDATRIERR